MLGQRTGSRNSATVIGYKVVRQYIAVKNFSLSPRLSLQADKVQAGHDGIRLRARPEVSLQALGVGRMWEERQRFTPPVLGGTNARRNMVV
jgi:hypothetical protein